MSSSKSLVDEDSRECVEAASRLADQVSSPLWFVFQYGWSISFLKLMDFLKRFFIVCILFVYIFSELSREFSDWLLGLC